MTGIIIILTVVALIAGALLGESLRERRGRNRASGGDK
jgi:hypothetical protein